MEKLSGDYIAGFVDGEGCFALKFRRDIRHERKNKPEYFYWDIEFVIVLRSDDREILERIRLTLGCGAVHINSNHQARYSVSDTNDLVFKIVPFFEKHKLCAKKRLDFDLWKEAVKLLHRNSGLKTNISSTGSSRGQRKASWPKKDLEKLGFIYDEMKKYKSKKAEWRWIRRLTNALGR